MESIDLVFHLIEQHYTAFDYAKCTAIDLSRQRIPVNLLTTVFCYVTLFAICKIENAQREKENCYEKPYLFAGKIPDHNCGGTLHCACPAAHRTFAIFSIDFPWSIHCDDIDYDFPPVA